MGRKLHKIPEMPNRMKERFERLFGKDYRRFEEILESGYRKSFRVNTLKISVSEAVSLLENDGFVIEKIPWTNDGFWVKDDSDSARRGNELGNSFEHFMGYIYIQGAASMIPSIVLDAKPGETVLDMCAAPGSKSTQIAAMMQNKGVLVLNDSDYKRIKMLRFNNDKTGVLNSVITNMDGKQFENSRIKFDRILLDAPCTGEGIIMREWDIIKRWNMKRVIGMCKLQKSLIKSAASALKPGGTLVYSTCTLSPEENEEVIDFALNMIGNLEIERIRIEGIKTRPGLVSWDRFTYDENVRSAMRIWPQDNGTEGFFIAKLRKVE